MPPCCLLPRASWTTRIFRRARCWWLLPKKTHRRRLLWDILFDWRDDKLVARKLPPANISYQRLSRAKSKWSWIFWPCRNLSCAPMSMPWTRAVFSFSVAIKALPHLSSKIQQEIWAMPRGECPSLHSSQVTDICWLSWIRTSETKKVFLPHTLFSSRFQPSRYQ